MPIHEYACNDCRKVLSFFVRGAAAAKQPACPHCGRTPLERVMSRFAVKTGSKTSARPPADGPPDQGAMDDDINPAQERRMERLMEEMGRDIDKIDENDPRQLGRLLRKFGEAAGEDLGPEFKEAVGRLEAGEDPEKVEEQLAGIFGDGDAEDDDGGGGGTPGAYARDETLYDL